MERTETTYGLRDARTKRVLRLEVLSNEGKSYCGDETVTLCLDRHGPLFEVASPLMAIRVLASDEDWFNSSRERPGWGGLKPEDLEIVRFDRVMTFDGPDGSDPVTVTNTVAEVPFPGFLEARRFPGQRNNLPAVLLRRYFDAEIGDEDRDYTQVTVLQLEAGMTTDEAVGLYVRAFGIGNTGRVVAIADLPEEYPLDYTHKEALAEGACLSIALVDFTPDSRIEPVRKEESRLAP